VLDKGTALKLVLGRAKRTAGSRPDSSPEEKKKPQLKTPWPQGGTKRHLFRLSESKKNPLGREERQGEGRSSDAASGGKEEKKKVLLSPT